MTAPNCHVPGQVVLLTRTCSQREFLLVNGRDGFIKRAIAYAFVLFAVRTNQVIHAFCLMSNHYHGGMTDRNARRSEFMQHAHNMCTKIVNQFRGRRESIWSSDKPGDTHLLDTETVIEKLLYIWLNPVKAGLVERVEEWDSFMILPKHWGKRLAFERPSFFNGRSDTPEVIFYTPMPPPGFEHMALQEVIALFEDWIREGEDAIKASRTRPVIGMSRCYTVNPRSTPTTSRPMFTLNPKFSGSCKQALSRVIAWTKHFRVRYAAALRVFIGGKEVVFPPGTLRMRTHFDCESESSLPSHPNFPRYVRYG